MLHSNPAAAILVLFELVFIWLVITVLRS